MPTHAQQVRRRLDALGATVTDTSPRGGLAIAALLPAGLRWADTSSHEISTDYSVGNRDAGFTALLNRIKAGTYECTAAECAVCGRRAAAPATDRPVITVALSGKAMSTIDGAALAAEAGTDAAHRAYAALAAAPGRQRGKGMQFHVTADLAAFAAIADYCQTVGARYAAQVGPDDGQVLLTAAERIRTAVTAAAPTDPEATA